MISDFYNAIINDPWKLLGGPITGVVEGLKGVLTHLL